MSFTKFVTHKLSFDFSFIGLMGNLKSGMCPSEV